MSTKSLPHEQNENVRALLRKILAEEFGGTVTHAAKALGISHSLIHEMLSGSRGAVFSEEPERPARRGHFVLQNACLPLRCGGSTCAVLHLPWHKDRPSRRLTIVHELLHGVGKRLGYHLSEADWWLCTAAFVHLAVRAGRATWYPTWFVGAIPSEIVALWP